MADNRLSDSDLIRRYLFLGTDQPFYIHASKPLDMDLGRRILQPVETLVRATAPDADEQTRQLANTVTLREAPLVLVRKALDTGVLVRTDECLFTLAYLARTFRLPEDKHQVYEAVPALIRESEDLFKFVSFYLSMGRADDPRGRVSGFGNGMKVALKKWYESHPADDLAKMLASDSGHLKWTHKHLLSMLHLNLADEEKMQVLDAAVGGIGRKRPPKPKKQKSPKKQRNNEAGEGSVPAAQEPAVPVPAPVPPAPVQQPLDVDTAALLIYRRYKAVKAAETLPSLQEKLVAFGSCSIKLISTQLHRSAAVWLHVLPNMPYKEVVQSSLVLQDYKLLKDHDSELSIAYGNRLNSMTAVTAAQVSPIFIYQVMRLFEEKQRYLNVVKEAVHSANNLMLKNLAVNPALMRYFYKALNESLHNCKSTGLRFNVTLDLRSKQSKKRVFANRLMSCQAASVLLTLPLLKKETNISIKTFTEQPHILRAVPLDKNMEFFDGCDLIQNHAIQKTKVNICQPIIEAQAAKQKVNVFLTIVDSLIRVNPRRTSPAETLAAYNAATKSKAVYIIVSLSRYKQDLDNVDNTVNGRVLELVGCTEDTPMIIDAYLREHFK